VVSNANYSEHLSTLRHSSIRGRSGAPSSSRTTPSSNHHGKSHLPEGINVRQISSDVFIAPHKLQHAIYEARRQVQLFNDKQLRREPNSPLHKNPVTNSLDARANARMSKYKNMWTSGEKIGLYYKDAERQALDLISRLNGNSSGTVPEGICLKERTKILTEIGEVKYIKGHPFVMETVLQCCKSKQWNERLRAINIMPTIFHKGDPTAVGVLVGRLLDWHLEVRRAAVQMLLDSAATLTLTAVGGRDLAQPEAANAVDRHEREVLALEKAAAAVAYPAYPAYPQSSARGSGGFSRVPSHAGVHNNPSDAGSRPATQASGVGSAMQAVGAFQRVASRASRRSSTSRTASAVGERRILVKPTVTMFLNFRLEDSEEDAGTQARTISQVSSRRPTFKGGGEKLRLKVKDPETAKLVIELVGHVNGGGPADDRCTFYGLQATFPMHRNVDTFGSYPQSISPDSRPSTQERILNQVFGRVTSAASMAALTAPIILDGDPLPPSTIILGRAETSLTDIANSIMKSEQWVQLQDGFGKPAGSISMKMTLDAAAGIGSSGMMGREMTALVAPALLDADATIRARALRLYQMCVSAGWEKERRRALANAESSQAQRQKQVL